MKRLLRASCALLVFTCSLQASENAEKNPECTTITKVNTHDGRVFLGHLYTDGQTLNTIIIKKATPTDAGYQDIEDYGAGHYLSMKATNKTTGEEVITPCFFINIELDTQDPQEIEEWKQIAKSFILDYTDCPAGFDTEYPHRLAPIALSIISKKQ